MSVKDETPELDRAQRRKQRTHGRILNAAETLLNTSGYAGLTVRAVTEAADVGHGTFYLHFDNLDDAVWAVIERQANAVNAQLNEELAPLPPRRRAYLSWIYMFEFVSGTRDLFLEMFGERGSAQLISAYQNWLAHIHGHNMTAGAYQPHDGPPVAFQAQYMAGATLRVLIWWASGGFQQPAAAMARMMYEMTYQEVPAADT